MHITSKGQVTIPQDIRNLIGLLPHNEVEFVVEGKRVYLQKARQPKQRGSRIVKHLRGRATMKMTTDEIMRYLRD